MKYIILILQFALYLISINANGQNANFTDNGFIPQTISIDGSFQTSCFNNGDVLVATSNGVWKNNITTKQWSTAGLKELNINCIFTHPTIANKIFAGTVVDNQNTTSLYISNDGGTTWTASETPNPMTIYCFAVSPSNPDHIYANVDATEIISSIDGGLNWTSPEGYIGYESNIIFTPFNDSIIYQGSENPLDCSWLGKYDIDNNDPSSLTNFKIVVGGQCGPLPGPWENRRPNILQTYSYTGNNIYVGQEGALSKVDPSQVNASVFLYKSTGEPDKPYTYIKGIWVDPVDTNHIIFGGGLNGDNTNLMQLYETWDEGTSFHRYMQTFSIVAPEVRNIIDLGDGRVAVIINDQGADKVKLIIMEPSQNPVGINTYLSQDQIFLFPNPAANILNINIPNYAAKNIDVEIFNIDGKLIKTENSISNTINIDYLEPGVYHLIFKIDNQIVTKKIVVE